LITRRCITKRFLQPIHKSVFLVRISHIIRLLHLNLLFSPASQNLRSPAIHGFESDSVTCISDPSYDDNSQRGIECRQVARSITCPEQLASNNSSQVTPAVEAQHERPFPRRGSVSGEPDDGERSGRI